MIKFYNEFATNQVDKQKCLKLNKLRLCELKKEFGPQYSKRLDQAKKLAVETLGNDILNNTILNDGSRLR